jgi:hypothetical protein
MSADRKLTELLDAATTDVPAAVAAPPLDAIHHRVRRRRQMAGAASALAVVVAVAGGFAVAHRTPGEPPAPVAPVVSPSVASAPAVPWTSAFVARDDTTVTLYTGADRCRQLNKPGTQVTAQDATDVTVSVTATIGPADDCSTSGSAVGLPLTLPAPLAGRTLIDAAGANAPPVYYERYLPVLRSGGVWSPIETSWDRDDPNWYLSYNGPHGTVLNLRAQPRSAPTRPPVGTMTLGPYQGTITGSTKLWTVCWPGGDATYCAQLEPAEGDSTTLASFKQQMAQLWP